MPTGLVGVDLQWEFAKVVLGSDDAKADTPWEFAKVDMPRGFAKLECQGVAQ
jgi:hypothetical protein